MSDATFVNILDIMNALKGFIENLTLPGGQPAFGEVRFYAQADLQQALDDLLVFEDRVCLIVPTGTTHTSQRIGGVQRTWRQAQFVLLLSDRVYGDINAETLQGNGETPGTVGLSDLLARALSGQQLDIPQCCLELGEGQPVRVEKENLPGRDCWSQELSTPAGFMEVPLQQIVRQR